MSLTQTHKVLACDIFMAFGVPPPAFSLWPVDVCANASQSCKIFDVRSSLFKYLSLPQKHRVAVDGGENSSTNYNSLRAMASNIRSLHASYPTGFSSFITQSQSQMVIDAASLSCYQMDGKTQQIKGPTQLATSSNDGNLAVLLQWATGSNTSVGWPDVISGCADYSKGRKGIQDRSRSRKSTGLSVGALPSTPRSSSVGTARSITSYSNWMDRDNDSIGTGHRRRTTPAAVATIQLTASAA